MIFISFCSKQESIQEIFKKNLDDAKTNSKGQLVLSFLGGTAFCFCGTIFLFGIYSQYKLISQNISKIKEDKE